MFCYFEKNNLKLAISFFFTLKRFVVVRICFVIVFCEYARLIVKINLTRDINRAFFLFENDDNV